MSFRKYDRDPIWHVLCPPYIGDLKSPIRKIMLNLNFLNYEQFSFCTKKWKFGKINPGLPKLVQLDRQFFRFGPTFSVHLQLQHWNHRTQSQHQRNGRCLLGGDGRSRNEKVRFPDRSGQPTAFHLDRGETGRREQGGQLHP